MNIPMHLWEKKAGHEGGDDRNTSRVTWALHGDTRQRLTSGLIYNNIPKLRSTSEETRTRRRRREREHLLDRRSNDKGVCHPFHTKLSIGVQAP